MPVPKESLTTLTVSSGSQLINDVVVLSYLLLKGSKQASKVIITTYTGAG